jgi:hypothetical protein
MQTLGYAYLIDRFRLPVLRQTPVARLSTAVNRRVDGETEILFPAGVAIEDSPLGHLEFALRHEGVDLAVIAAAFATIISLEEVVERLRVSPNGDSSINQPVSASSCLIRPLPSP